MPGKTAPDQPKPIQDPEQLRNLLLVLEHARADAWLRHDRRALEALLAPEFIEINYSGRLSKDDLLIRLFPRVTLHTYTIEDPVLIIASETAAVLTYQCFEEFTLDTKKRKGTFHVAALYRTDGRQWKLAFWQITPFTNA